MHRRKITASGRLQKATHNSLVFGSVLGPSLYFNKTCFEGDVPKKAVITIEWETERPATPELTIKGSADVYCSLGCGQFSHHPPTGECPVELGLKKPTTIKGEEQYGKTK